MTPAAGRSFGPVAFVSRRTGGSNGRVIRKHKTEVEFDGEQHDESQYDVTRDRWLEAQGWTVVRFWNTEVLGHLTMVLNTVAGQCYSSRNA